METTRFDEEEFLVKNVNRDQPEGSKLQPTHIETPGDAHGITPKTPTGPPRRKTERTELNRSRVGAMRFDEEEF